MSNMLHIMSSPQPSSCSVSKKVANAFIDAYCVLNPDDNLKEIDLYQTDIPFISEIIVNVWNGSQTCEDDLVYQDLKRLDELCDEFISADKYVFSIPNWNSFAPPVLVEYVLAVMRLNKAFKYTKDGSITGLLKGKKAMIVIASGYTCSAPNSFKCYAGPWIKQMLVSCGINDVDELIVEGIDERPEQASCLVEVAMKRAVDKAGSF